MSLPLCTLSQAERPPVNEHKVKKRSELMTITSQCEYKCTVGHHLTQCAPPPS